MPIPLTQLIQDQITNNDIKKQHVFKLNGVDYTSFLRSWSVSFDRTFGSASGVFILNNDDGRFSLGGTHEIDVGDEVELIEKFENDPTQFKKFFGRVEKRSIAKAPKDRDISLSCLDYISVLQNWDVDLKLEGTTATVENENLTPNYLPDPNDMFAQVFDFANDAIADKPAPILLIKDKVFLTEEPQFDGFDILFDVGQVKLGAPLNTKDNFDLIAKSYTFYTQGLHVEDIIETLLTTADGYGKFLFGEPSAQAVIDNHLKTTFQDVDGEGVLDQLTPNLSSSTITIKHNVPSAVTAEQTTLTLDSVDGLPASGSGTVNGDAFTWTNIDGATKTLTGIPASGDNALRDHPANSFMAFENTYPAGQVWFLTYSNVTSTLTTSDFIIPESAKVGYFDKRIGRIILDKSISIGSFVRCNVNYEFKTLQATGVELNKINFRSREVENRYKALQKLRSYLAPNYIVRTVGDNKIWSDYLSQKTKADYTLDLVKRLNYLEDEDLYTRVKMFGKNKNPTNLVFEENVDFSETGQSFKSIATQNELSFDRTENGWHIFKSVISDAGYITSDVITPTVFLNGFPIDDTLKQAIFQPVTVERTTTTKTTVESSKWGGTDVTVQTFTYYKIHFAHQNIEPSEEILLYNPVGVNTFTISPNDSNMNYGLGIYNAPGNTENAVLENLSTATYWIHYSTKNLEIDYLNVEFKINDALLPNPDQSTVTATYEYYTVFTPQKGVGSIMDGRYDTQVQTEFFSQPPSGFPYAILDLGAVKTIQAVDIIAGFYRPDDILKFDIEMRFTLQSSLDNVTYNNISSDTSNIELSGGQSISLEEQELGVDFQARYIKINLENVKKVDFGDGVYPVAFTEIAIFDDIILSSDAKLIPTTGLTKHVSPGDTTILVDSTAEFTDPSSGGNQTAFLGTDGDSFTYTGLTSTSFTGVDLSSGASAAITEKVYQTQETDVTLYDNDNFLDKLGDRVFKDVRISDEVLYTQAQLDSLAKDFLKEFYKEHTKVTVDIVYAPYLQVGHTVSLTDSYNNISNQRYFIEQIIDNNGAYRLILARFP